MTNAQIETIDKYLSDNKLPCYADLKELEVLGFYSDVTFEKLYCFLHRGVFTVMANDPDISCDEIIVPTFQSLWEKLPPNKQVGETQLAILVMSKDCIEYMCEISEMNISECISNKNITSAAAKLWIKVEKSNQKAPDIWGGLQS
jgi:hypothetical protein